MNSIKSFLFTFFKAFVTEKLVKRLIVFALKKYAESNDNELTHTVVQGVEEALEPKKDQ